METGHPRLATDTDNGLLLIISGPSGVGKTTITRGVERSIGDSVFSVSYTTRAKTDADTEGVDYHFIDDTDFDTMVDNDEFLEWADVFGKKYGTRQKWVEEQLARGRLVILEIDVKGAQQVKAKMPDAFGLFIMPPSEDELLSRLQNRKRESEEQIQKRFAEAKSEMDAANALDIYDTFIVNEHLDESIEKAVAMQCAHQPPKTRSIRLGFTLIELLVVIAIIALLISILLPALGSARSSARSVMCLSSMRSLGMALSTYLDDSNEHMPRSKHSVGFNGGLPWAPRLYPYLTGADFEGQSDLWQSQSWWSATNQHYRCPHDRRQSPIEEPGLPFMTPAISYGLNVYYELRHEEIDPTKHGNTTEPYRKRSSIPHPSLTISIGEMKDTINTDHIMPHFWRTRGVEPGFEVAHQRHGDNAGYLMLDGHAETRTLLQVYDQSNNRDDWHPKTAR